MIMFLFGASLMLVLLVYMTFVEPKRVVIERVVVRDRQLADKLHGLRVVHLSDLHLKKDLGLRERLLLEKLSDLKPDLIFFSGDFVDNREAIPVMQSFARLLSARIGVFAVAGNNDHHAIHPTDLSHLLADTPVQILSNTNRRLSLPNGEYIWIVGVDDPTTGHDNLSGSLPVLPQDPIIMLCHSPALFKAASAAGVRLLLTGHTHGGQVRIPGVVQIFHKVKGGGPLLGLYREQETFMYINRGIGTRTVPFRFLCPPEITVLEFTH